MKLFLYFIQTFVIFAGLFAVSMFIPFLLTRKDEDLIWVIPTILVMVAGVLTYTKWDSQR